MPIALSLPTFAGRRVKPPARNASNRAAQQDLGEKGERDRDDHRLGRIECLEHDQPIDGVIHSPSKMTRAVEISPSYRRRPPANGLASSDQK
jgi:hypothetical protein